jgi:hypothetical protein
MLCGLLCGAAGASKYRVYIGSFGNKTDADQLRKELTSELSKSGDIEVVDSSSKANAILAGDSEIYVRSYVSLYARAGTSPEHGHPIYGGYVSVELKDSSGETLWSYLSALHSGSKHAAHDLSKDITRHLLTALPSLTGKK